MEDPISDKQPGLAMDKAFVARDGNTLLHGLIMLLFICVQVIVILLVFVGVPVISWDAATNHSYVSGAIMCICLIVGFEMVLHRLLFKNNLLLLWGMTFILMGLSIYFF